LPVEVPRDTWRAPRTNVDSVRSKFFQRGGEWRPTAVGDVPEAVGLDDLRE
jgi:hypothetical protein